MLKSVLMGVVIFAHPNPENSTTKINKFVTNTIKEYGNFEIRDLYKLYPDFKINIESEKKAILETKNIIFEFPLYWYSSPAILKEWIDKVLQHNWAYGENFALRNKNFYIIVTTGGSEEYYEKNDMIEEILLPIIKTAEYVKMNYKGTLLLSTNLNQDKRKQKINDFLSKIKND